MVLDILSYGFMQNALLAGMAIAVICSFMGLFLVQRRYSLFGDGISHVAFGGIAIGLFTGIFPLWTAFLVSILGGIGLQKLRSSTKISGDAAVAVVLVSGLSIGVVLVSASGGFSVDLFSFLFGSILLISFDDMMLITSISAGITATLFALRKKFLHISFNEDDARLSGLNVPLLNYVFVIIAAIIVVTSMRMTGILLISALMVVPNISAMMYGRGFIQTLIISISIAVSAVIAGIFTSYYLDVAPSGATVMIAVAILFGTMACRAAGLLSVKTPASRGISDSAPPPDTPARTRT